jgi:hypothetical protein
LHTLYHYRVLVNRKNVDDLDPHMSDARASHAACRRPRLKGDCLQRLGRGKSPLTRILERKIGQRIRAKAAS